MSTYQIPKLRDIELIQALGRIRAAIAPQRQFFVRAAVPHGADVDLPDNNPETAPPLNYFLELNGRALQSFYLMDRETGTPVIRVTRKPNQVWDDVEIVGDWINNIRHDQRQQIVPPIFANLHTQIQKELRTDQLQASMVGHEDTAWNRYREAQAAILISLESTTQKLLVQTAREIEAARTAEANRTSELQASLKSESEKERQKLADEYGTKKKEIEEREEALKKELARFETREARFVAREETKKQLKQLEDWLKDSSLTKETIKKRAPVGYTYVTCMVITGALTVWLNYENLEILKVSAAKLADLAWWKWLTLAVKSIVPFLAFSTFAIYYIKWQNAWAKQHADEELRTRARVVDIGRSSWLFEAVRDANDSNKDLPPELIKELSKNLFATAQAGDGGDMHPQAVTDMLMQGLTSLRFKTPDGSEVEAKRGKG